MLAEFENEPRASTVDTFMSTVRPPRAVNPAGLADRASMTPVDEGTYTPPRARDCALVVV